MTEQFVIQSDASMLPVVEERLFHFCHECHVGNYYATISVATLQAVENAIVHGNRGDLQKCVRIAFGQSHGGLFVEVADEGMGFNFERFGELPAGEGESGVGIFVMRTLCDRLEFLDEGRKVRMEFLVAGIDPADAIERVAVLQRYWLATTTIDS